MTADTGKPPIEDLRQFLQFQLSRQWAPEHSQTCLGSHWKNRVKSGLRLGILGPMLYINTIPVSFHLCLLICILWVEVFHVYYVLVNCEPKKMEMVRTCNLISFSLFLFLCMKKASVVRLHTCQVCMVCTFPPELCYINIAMR